MNRLRYALVICVIASFTNTILGGEQAATNQTFRLALSLSDGSVVIGTPCIASIPLQTSYATMDIPLKQIHNIKIESDHETVALALTNGDQLKGLLNLKPIELETTFGKVAINLQYVTGVSVYQNGKSSLPAALQDSLLLYLSFDKDEGSQVTDASGKGNHGKVQGATYTSSGKIGGAYEFDGVDDYINIPFTSGVDNNSTLSAWFNGVTGLSADSAIIAVERDAGNYFINLGVNGVSGGKISFCIKTFDGSTAGEYDSRYNYNLDVWHHVVGLRDTNSDTISLYVDGVFDGSTADPTSVQAYSQAKIGHVSPHSYIKGSIDEVMIFNRALSADEVKTLYNSQK